MEEAFHEIFRRFHRPLEQFFRRRGFDAACADLSQETLLRVYRSRRSFRGEVPLASWIFQIAHHVFQNELRRKSADKRSAQVVSLDEDGGSVAERAEAGGSQGHATAPAEPQARTLWRELVGALKQALPHLPPQGRRVLQLRIVHDYSVAQIAELMKITESTVKVHLHQARKRLRKLLGDRFGELPF